MSRTTNWTPRRPQAQGASPPEAPARAPQAPSADRQLPAADRPAPVPTFAPERMAAIMAVRWTQHPGLPSMQWDLMHQLLADYLRQPLNTITDDMIYRWCNQPEGSLIGDAQDLLRQHQLLPPPPPGTFRVNHSFGLSARAPARERLIDLLVRQGVRPQAAGTGRYSESPHDVFGVVDQPPGEYGHRCYSQDAPWVTADIRPDPDICNYYQRHMPGPGNVVTLYQIPSRMIVAINGYPLRRFLTVRRQLLGRIA